MKIEFTLKDRNGIELQEGDSVNWCCENTKPIQVGNISWNMWNDGQVIPGKLIFYKSKEQVRTAYRNRPHYQEYINNEKENYRVNCCPSNSAILQLMFVSDNGDITWCITCPFEVEDYRHSKLEKR